MNRPIETSNESGRLANSLVARTADQPAPVHNAAVIAAQNLRLASCHPDSPALRSVLSAHLARLEVSR